MSGGRRDKANWLLGHLPGDLIGQAEGVATAGLTVHLFAHRSTRTPVLVPAVAEPLLVWIVAGSARVEERDGGEWRAVEVGAGDLFVIDSSEPYELRWEVLDGDFHVLHVYLGVPLVEAAAAAIYGRPQRPTLREQSVCRHSAISALLKLIYAELARPAPGSLFVIEAVGKALAAAVLRLYADTDAPISRRGVLPSNRLRRVIQHMNDHLPEPFSLRSLASTTGMSPFHFGRTFKRSTGCSPQEYFTNLRVNEARRLLRETEQPVIEVAMAVGYANPSHFTQIFCRVTGMTPTTFRGSKRRPT